MKLECGLLQRLGCQNRGNIPMYRYRKMQRSGGVKPSCAENVVTIRPEHRNFNVVRTSRIQGVFSRLTFI
jgi:hypothetical protein